MASLFHLFWINADIHIANIHLIIVIAGLRGELLTVVNSLWACALALFGVFRLSFFFTAVPLNLRAGKRLECKVKRK